MASKKQPNILWICTDQQRYDTLGCYGNEFVRTPNIDRLAQRGVVFDHFYVQSPVCAPSRASFLTGRYPRTTRLRQNGQDLPDDEVLVTRMLADAGYVGGLVGKLHLAGVGAPGVSDAEAHRGPPPEIERRKNDGYVYFHWSSHPLPDWRDTTDHRRTDDYAYWLREQGVEYPFRAQPFRGSEYVESGIEARNHQTAWCAEKAISFIEANAPFQQPWLMSVNPFAPHHPFDPPPEYLERYLDRLDDIPPPGYVEGELDDKPVFQRLCHEGAYNVPGQFRFDSMTEYDHRLVRAAYWAMIDLIDAQVGRMIACLERTGQLDDTLVILSSDHGEMLGDHGIYLKGPFFYDGAVRVPFIVSWPGGIEGGRRSDALVEAVDIVPTLLDAAGLPRHPGIQGRSLWPMLNGRTGLGRHRDDVYSEYYNAAVMFDEPQAHLTMVGTDRYKLVSAHGLDSGELYDLHDDPGETRNLWHDPGQQASKIAMLTRLADRMAWTMDPLPERASRPS